MGVSLVSFLVGVCIAAIVRKTISTLRFFEYLKFIKSLKVKIPKLKKTFPIGAGVAASIMSSPGLKFEKIAGSKAGQRFGELMVDTQQKYLDDLRRAGGEDPDGILARQRKRDLKYLLKNKMLLMLL